MLTVEKINVQIERPNHPDWLASVLCYGLKVPYKYRLSPPTIKIYIRGLNEAI
jgi:hypothetical protein